jgi:hypothetical protein
MNRAIVLLGCLACVTPAPAPTPQGAAGPKARELFPLALGNRWTYDVSFKGAKQSLSLSIVSADGSTFTDSRNQKFILDHDGVRDEHRYLLKEPVAAGSKWMSIIDVSSTENYAIAEVGTSVEVPAGRFDGCVRVEACSPQGPGSALVAEQTYCPGVGLTRLVTYHEQDGNRGSVQWNQELASYHVAPVTP